MQVGHEQGLYFAQDGHAVRLALQLQGLRVKPGLPGQRLGVVQPGNQRNKTCWHLIRSTSVLRQRLQRVIKVTSAMRPATQMNKLMSVGNRVVE